MSLHAKLADSHPKLRRGRVWCHSCGAYQDVDTQSCLQGGWPKHCGQTMSLDSPSERGNQTALAEAFAGVELTDAQRRSIDWLAGWERSTVDNIVQAILAARAVAREEGDS